MATSGGLLPPSVAGTAELIAQFDTIFDCLNARLLNVQRFTIIRCHLSLTTSNLSLICVPWLGELKLQTKNWKICHFQPKVLESFANNLKWNVPGVEICSAFNTVSLHQATVAHKGQPFCVETCTFSVQTRCYSMEIKLLRGISPLFCHGKPFLRTNMQLLRGNTHLLRGNTAASPLKRVAFMWNTIRWPERGTSSPQKHAASPYKLQLLGRNTCLLRGIFVGFIRRGGGKENQVTTQPRGSWSQRHIIKFYTVIYWFTYWYMHVVF
jgi:hypothetical protein